MNNKNAIFDERLSRIHDVSGKTWATAATHARTAGMQTARRAGSSLIFKTVASASVLAVMALGIMVAQIATSYRTTVPQAGLTSPYVDGMYSFGATNF